MGGDSDGVSGGGVEEGEGVGGDVGTHPLVSKGGLHNEIVNSLHFA